MQNQATRRTGGLKATAVAPTPQRSRASKPEFADPAALAKRTDAKVEATPVYTIVYPYRDTKNLVVVYLPSREQCEAAHLHHTDMPGSGATSQLAPEAGATTAKAAQPAAGQAGEPGLPPCCRHNDAVTISCSYDPSKVKTQAEVDREQPPPPPRDVPLPGIHGLTLGEYDCVMRANEAADPIGQCHVPAERVGGAMDFIVQELYAPVRGVRLATSWVESHCKAVPAIPNNKWVCTYGGVTREYQNR